MRSGHFPFEQMAVDDDPIYEMLYKNKPEVFWKIHEKTFPSDFFSDEFKDLIT